MPEQFYNTSGEPQLVTEGIDQPRMVQDGEVVEVSDIYAHQFRSHPETWQVFPRRPEKWRASDYALADRGLDKEPDPRDALETGTPTPRGPNGEFRMSDYKDENGVPLKAPTLIEIWEQQDRERAEAEAGAAKGGAKRKTEEAAAAVDA